MQRSCTDVNFPFKESAELTQGLINNSKGGPDEEQLELPVGGAGPKPVL